MKTALTRQNHSPSERIQLIPLTLEDATSNSTRQSPIHQGLYTTVEEGEGVSRTRGDIEEGYSGDFIEPDFHQSNESTICQVGEKFRKLCHLVCCFPCFMNCAPILILHCICWDGEAWENPWNGSCCYHLERFAARNVCCVEPFCLEHF